MKITIKTFATGIVASVFLLASCKKGDDGPAGNNGANGANGVVAMSTDGFIKGNVSGTRQDGTAFNEAFNYQNYWGGPSGTLDSVTVANYKFSISRGGTDMLGDNSAMLSVTTTSKNASTGSITLSNFSFTKSLGTNKKFEFMLNNNATTTITGLIYNASTGLFTGNFSFTLTGVQNTTGNAATISGSFQATMTQIYNLTMHTPTGVHIANSKN
ncbi:MAG: hypothetical protein HY062_12760 [Bacteroidetes bacterium]|nr:hypothetical protein [Bacteroidota bacterium]